VVKQGVLGEVPQFLQHWQRRMVLAGVQLRLLRALPAPLSALAGRLAAVASAEAAQCSAACVTDAGTSCACSHAC
jgi:hypothetical protein